jgi:putative ABC transport system permease protein
MGSILQDLRYAARVLAKSPGFAVVAILTLALAIGANVATFGVVHSILLSPLPFHDSAQLVRVFDDYQGSNTKNVGMSEPELYDFQNSSGVFEDISAVWPISADFTGGDRPERVEAVATSANFMTLLGAHAELGRVYGPQDAAPGFSQIVDISDALWRREFGADPNILGKNLRLDSDLYTVVGVMPPDFRHPGRTLETDTEMWLPCGFAALPFPTPPVRAARFIPGAIGRLKPGVTIEQAQAQLQTYAAHLSQQYPTEYPPAQGWTPLLVSVQEDLVGNVRSELLVLFGAVVFVLLIGCVNLATFLLARSVARQREIAVRLALGASRGRLIRQLLTESLLLATLAGGMALATILWLQHWLVSLAPADLPRLAEVTFGGRTLLFAFALSVVTGVLFGLAPALQAAKLNQISSLREGSRGAGSSGSHRRLSRILVAAEIALSLVLLIGAGLLLRSFRQLMEVNPGFNPHELVTAHIWLPVPNNPAADPYRPMEKRAAFLRELVRRVDALPGVQMAAADGSNSISLSADRNSSAFTIDGRGVESSRTPVATVESVGPAYFSVLQAPLLSGRVFNDADDTKSQLVALIDNTLAQRYWPNEDPVGKRVKLGPVTSQSPWMTIVGVVGNIKTDGFDAPTPPHLYVSVYQNVGYSMTLYVRTNAATGTLGESIRHEVSAIDPGLPVFAIRTAGEVVAKSLGRQRFALQIIGIFAVVALLLAAIGIYGVMAYSVSQRTHEFGIRIALGAQRRDILRMAVGEGMVLVVAGVIAGVAGSLLLTQFLRTLLYSVTPTDPLTFVTIPALLAAVALAACLVPAQRATRVDPLVALREE